MTDAGMLEAFLDLLYMETGMKHWSPDALIPSLMIHC